MSRTTIDSRTENRTIYFARWTFFFKTNIKLENLGEGKLGLSYDLAVSGMWTGRWSDGPFEVKSNGTIEAHISPSVKMIVTHFQNENGYVSLNVEVKFQGLNVPPSTVFQKTLGGYYKSSTGLAEFEELASKYSERSE